MSLLSRTSLGFGFGVLAVASLGYLGDAPPVPVVDKPYTPSAATGGSGGQPQTYDWRSINDLFKTDKQRAERLAIMQADDDAVIMAVVAAVTRDIL
jgi:hypothetical protein